MNQQSFGQGSSPFSDTPVSIAIIILCAVVFLTGFQPLGFMLWPLESGVFAPWQLVSYGGAVHSFTDPHADQPGAAMYDEKIARRAFASMRDFLNESFSATP